MSSTANCRLFSVSWLTVCKDGQSFRLQTCNVPKKNLHSIVWPAKMVAKRLKLTNCPYGKEPLNSYFYKLVCAPPSGDNAKIISRPQSRHWQTNGRCHKDSGHLSTQANSPVNIIDCAEPERVNFPLHHTVHGWHGDSQNKRGCITFEGSNIDILAGQGATAAATAVGNWLKYFVFLTHAVSLLCLQQCGTWPLWMKRYLFATLKYPLSQYKGIILC